MFQDIFKFVKVRHKYLVVGSEAIGFIAVASCEVLGGDDSHLLRLVLQKNKFAVVIAEIAFLNHIVEEMPEAQSLLHGFEVEQKAEVLYRGLLSDEIKSPDKFFAYAEARHPDAEIIRMPRLSDATLQDVRQLQLISQGCLQWLHIKRTEVFGEAFRLS